MKMELFARTSKKIPVFKYSFGQSGPRALIIGGVHGDEPEGVIAAQGVLAALNESFNLNLQVTIIPEFNPEGILMAQRMNSNGVDLNRNLPTKDWSPIAAKERYFPGPSANSEPENKALVQLLEAVPYDLIISLHSWNPMININGPGCEPEAEVLKKHTGYAIEPDIGYPTPGSLGTYSGKERNIATITFEIQREIAFDQISKIHVPALLECLKQTEKRAKK
jgi:murein peptide amidase A